MKYMGSKNRISKHILPLILKDRLDGQFYVEPFVGGGNMIDKVDGLRIGADLNPYCVKALEFIRDEMHNFPDVVTEDMYDKLKSKRVIDGITGFVSFEMSFGGKFFGGYRRDVAGSKGCMENMRTQTRRARNNGLKQSKNLKGVDFVNCSYLDLFIPNNSIVYCDPPYKGTTGYKTGKFNHSVFWEWCRTKTKEGHKVYVSEYNAPSDFKCIWQKELNNGLNNNKESEKLFVYCF